MRLGPWGQVPMYRYCSLWLSIHIENTPVTRRGAFNSKE